MTERRDCSLADLDLDLTLAEGPSQRPSWFRNKWSGGSRWPFVLQHHQVGGELEGVPGGFVAVDVAIEVGPGQHRY